MLQNFQFVDNDVIVKSLTYLRLTLNNEELQHHGGKKKYLIICMWAEEGVDDK